MTASRPPAGTLSRAAALALLSLYDGVGHIAYPVLSLLHRRRARLGKEDPARRGERFGAASQPRPEGDLVWVHAASVGETNAVMPVVRALTDRGLKVVLTSGTVTSAKTAAERLPDGALHQYVPYDLSGGVAAFLDYWRPAVVMLVESEIWPATFRAVKRRGLPLAILNGRMSPKSTSGWLKARALAQTLFGLVDVCLARSEEDAENYRSLGVRDVRVVGDLKFESPVPDADPAALEDFRRWIDGRPIWLAASTHPGEEEVVAEVHRRLRDEHPGLLTLLAPRHPNRSGEIRVVLEGRGLNVAVRSRHDLPGPETDVYLADTIGEMGLFYRLSPIVFMGGSFMSAGGHNPLEPAFCGAAILTGPGFANQQDVYDRLIAEKGTLVVHGAEDLAETLSELLHNPRHAAEVAAAAGRTAHDGQGAVSRTMDALSALLPRNGAA
ncbi:3-deoxy-D-manno-octulosonic acid transferase [Stappia sp. F7233]|uniref:3-deoxy-D-manno-octulosonic acid transferase n=1 Tax=Stappia albiluteola TaxID=2758565 RepID=A0A839AEW6_9HYPH|nr:3-deoxy-D-manno-octulosonic acid transferase [Stappia albiluteola]MBA5778370.1 3-deoxy-D-manno-octulosonic acid transferase [Stappia albiluteola]